MDLRKKEKHCLRLISKLLIKGCAETKRKEKEQEMW